MKSLLLEKWLLVGEGWGLDLIHGKRQEGHGVKKGLNING